MRAIGDTIECTACPRLAENLCRQREAHPDYFNAPVPSFGLANGDLLVVGLAPGLHGANRTGRPFTGDYAGVLLYETLHTFGFANIIGTADPTDGLQLRRCAITNAVKCLPPANKPEPAEVRECNRFLRDEIASFNPRAILALGLVAHQAVLRAHDQRVAEFRFQHGAQHQLRGAENGSGVMLFDSYHCSRYNTQTRRLTPDMFRAVVGAIVAHLDEASRD